MYSRGEDTYENDAIWDGIDRNEDSRMSMIRSCWNDITCQCATKGSLYKHRHMKIERTLIKHQVLCIVLGVQEILLVQWAFTIMGSWNERALRKSHQAPIIGLALLFHQSTNVFDLGRQRLILLCTSDLTLSLKKFRSRHARAALRKDFQGNELGRCVSLSLWSTLTTTLVYGLTSILYLWGRRIPSDCQSFVLRLLFLLYY